MRSERDARIEKLTAELNRLKREQAAELEARRGSVTPQFIYVLATNSQARERIADPNCVWYRLEGVVVNGAELRAVGATVPESGGMNYLFNCLSGRFVISAGGGRVHLNLVDGAFGRADVQAFKELEAFVSEHPGGGDVTEIVTRGRARREAMGESDG